MEAIKAKLEGSGRKLRAQWWQVHFPTHLHQLIQFILVIIHYLSISKNISFLSIDLMVLLMQCMGVRLRGKQLKKSAGISDITPNFLRVRN